MDSPLMPTLRGQHADSSDLLADLSLVDADDSFMPGTSPTDLVGGLPARSTSPDLTRSNAPFSFASRAPPPAPDFSRGASRAHAAPGEVEPEPVVEIKSKPKPRFSLFAPLQSARPTAGSSSSRTYRPSTQPTSVRSRAGDAGERADEGDNGEAEGDQTIGPDQMGRASGAEGDQAGGRGVEEREGNEADRTMQASVTGEPQDGEDKLRASLYELRQMNEVFDGFLEALESARGHHQRLEIRVQQTKSLLDHYTAMLGQTHHTEKLLSNPNWHGSTEPPATATCLPSLRERKLTDQEQRQISAEEAEREAEAERQRIAEERAAEAARIAEEDRARRAEEAQAARERAAAQIRGGSRGRARGWGGTSTSSRGGARGTGIPTTSRIPSASTRTGATSGIGRGGSTAGSGTGVKRTVSGTAGGSATAGSGVGKDRWANVPSSGYGRRAA